jgi:uncharacterized DUF497 family protein
MEFEFDANKSLLNEKKHGINFINAQKLWYNVDRIEIPTKYIDEQRNILIGKIDEAIWSAIFTYRDKKVRLISVRRARDNEKEIYES